MESAAPNGPVVRGRCHSPYRDVFEAFAEFERNLILERTVAGLKAARARGRKGARPTSSDPKKLDRYPEVGFWKGFTGPSHGSWRITGIPPQA